MGANWVALGFGAGFLVLSLILALQARLAERAGMVRERGRGIEGLGKPGRLVRRERDADGFAARISGMRMGATAFLVVAALALGYAFWLTVSGR